MTARLWCQLACDAPGCRANSGRCYGSHLWVRKQQRAKGWRYDPIRGDLCDKHAPTPSPPEDR